MGVDRYTPSAAVAGDKGWTPTLIRQWKSVSNVRSRHSVLPNSRINKRIFFMRIKMLTIVAKTGLSESKPI